MVVGDGVEVVVTEVAGEVGLISDRGGDTDGIDGMYGGTMGC